VHQVLLLQLVRVLLKAVLAAICFCRQETAIAVEKRCWPAGMLALAQLVCCRFAVLPALAALDH
jgi:hypothetical protein